MIILVAVAIFVFMYYRTRNEQVQEMQEQERLEREAAELTAKRNAEWAAKELAKQTAERAAYFRNSRLLPEIIQFITEDGLPYMISINQDGIVRYSTPPHYLNYGCYRFRDHYIDDIPSADLLPLANAINDALNYRFTDIKNGVYTVYLERPTPALRKF